jgi:PilZ domain
MSYAEKGSAHTRSQEKSAAVNEAERRTSDRQLFPATAEVIEEVTGARFATRTMDLGPGGCFIDTTNPLPVGSRVQVKIFKGKGEFKTNGSVVYSQNGMGMGIAFLELSENKQGELQAWLEDILGAKPCSEVTAAASKIKLSEVADSKSLRAVTRLIRLLITKGILTEAEASSVLHDPVL